MAFHTIKFFEWIFLPEGVGLGAAVRQQSLDSSYFDEKELGYKAACHCLGEAGNLVVLNSQEMCLFSWDPETGAEQSWKSTSPCRCSALLETSAKKGPQEGTCSNDSPLNPSHEQIMSFWTATCHPVLLHLITFYFEASHAQMQNSSE